MTSIVVKPACSGLWYSQTYLLLIFMEIPSLRGHTQSTIYIGEKREIMYHGKRKKSKFSV